MSVVVCLFHQDLRIDDNPALDAAVKSGNAVIPLYILDDEAAGAWKAGGASRWWLHHSLASLSAALEGMGSRLIIARGKAEDIIPRLFRELGAVALYAHHRCEPWSKSQLSRIERALKGRARLHLADGVLLKPSGSVLSKKASRFRVFTPFMKALLREDDIRLQVACPTAIPAPENWPQSLPLKALELLPTKVVWSDGIAAAWQVGETAAHKALTHFTQNIINNYDIDRDFPSMTATSRLSPHLHFGEISPVMIYHHVMARASGDGVKKFLAEIIWREFSYELLDQFPSMPETPLQEKFNSFPWRNKQGRIKRGHDNYADDLKAWQQGMTGYPLVDAGMRELTETGWMHNRVRMITASFLTKHLLIPWQEGQCWFFDRLVDADLASNSANWQWVAGCGADAAPYFRIFNPITQGHKFNAHDYVRRWVPEIAGRDDRALFTPRDFTSSAEGKLAKDLQDDNSGYPPPLVDHPYARVRALEAFQMTKPRDENLELE